jgi:hypothetical protein
MSSIYSNDNQNKFNLEEIVEEMIILTGIKEKVNEFFSTLKISEVIDIIEKHYLQSSNIKICLPSIVEIFISADNTFLCEYLVDKISLDDNQICELDAFIQDHEKSDEWKIKFAKKWLTNLNNQVNKNQLSVK